MSEQGDFRPNWTSLPGETISALVSQKGLTLEHCAKQMKRSKSFLQNLIEGQVQIDDEIAKELNAVLGGSINFWVNRQLQFNKDAGRISAEKEAAWIKQFPIKEMLGAGWIKDSGNRVADCLNFFGVPNIPSWEATYGQIFAETAFRKSPTFASQLGPTAAWIRHGEIKGHEIACKAWDMELFEQTLFEVKSLTRKKYPKDFLPALKHACAKCGVALVIAPSPTGCRASGVTKFLSERKALILLSFRYLSDDQFWFTFFHEAGHLLLHGNKKMFLEGIQEGTLSDVEAEANAFAGEHLIPHHLQAELSKLRGNQKDIIRFAMKAGVSPGIVVGQMQFYDYVSKKYLNGFKRTYAWDDIPLD